MGSERPDLGSERLDLGSGRPDLGSEWPDLGSEKPDFGSERPDLESERPYLRLWEGGTGRKTETGENCLLWNHRSLAPPGPLPKNIHIFGIFQLIWLRFVMESLNGFNICM